MKLFNSVVLSAFVALGSTAVSADTTSTPLLLNDAQMDTVDAGRRWHRPQNTWGSASATGGGTVVVNGAVSADGGGSASSSGFGGAAATAGGDAGAIGLRIRGPWGARLSGGAGYASGYAASCSGAACP